MLALDVIGGHLESMVQSNHRLISLQSHVDEAPQIAVGPRTWGMGALFICVTISRA